jgi:rare lipoprotein A
MACASPEAQMRPLPLLLALSLAACASAPKPRPAGVKLGGPYTVLGRTYVPRDEPRYDERGIASWYGPGFHAKQTANGETYDQDDVTAAHKTLPMPSFVEVTNLDNGRQMVVRINDRGPFVEGRIIDLSRRSAQLLGVDRAGLARVRVRRVYPEGAPPARPQVRIDTPAALPPAPVPTVAAAQPVQPAPPGAFFVQVAALSDAGRAAWLAGFLAPLGRAAATPAPAGLWRVRLGPYATAAEAGTALAAVRDAGYTEAVVVRP